jgi:hypothetical protein
MVGWTWTSIGKPTVKDAVTKGVTQQKAHQSAGQDAAKLAFEIKVFLPVSLSLAP